MKWFAETTEWDNPKIVNHVYLMADDRSKIYAYKPFGTGAVQTFKDPIRIDTRGRKFVVNPVQFPTEEVKTEPVGRSWTVKGSKGDEYTVTELDGAWACTCSGFRFRGHCRHIEEANK